jgi:hypothetical protein
MESVHLKMMRAFCGTKSNEKSRKMASMQYQIFLPNLDVEENMVLLRVEHALQRFFSSLLIDLGRQLEGPLDAQNLSQKRK